MFKRITFLAKTGAQNALSHNHSPPIIAPPISGTIARFSPTKKAPHETVQFIINEASRLNASGILRIRITFFQSLREHTARKLVPREMFLRRLYEILESTLLRLESGSFIPLTAHFVSIPSTFLDIRQDHRLTGEEVAGLNACVTPDCILQHRNHEVLEETAAAIRSLLLLSETAKSPPIGPSRTTVKNLARSTVQDG